MRRGSASQLATHALAADELTFEPEAIRHVIRDYTREAGVRNLEREIAAVTHKIALSGGRGTAGSGAHHAGRTTRPGVATGLAWTPTGVVDEAAEVVRRALAPSAPATSRAA